MEHSERRAQHLKGVGTFSLRKIFAEPPGDKLGSTGVERVQAADGVVVPGPLAVGEDVALICVDRAKGVNLTGRVRPQGRLTRRAPSFPGLAETSFPLRRIIDPLTIVTIPGFPRQFPLTK